MSRKQRGRGCRALGPLLLGGAVAAVGLLGCGAEDERDAAPDAPLTTSAQALASTCVTLRRGTLGAVADTYVGQEKSGANYGGVVVASSGVSSGFASLALFRWDLGAIPPGALVLNASVTLHQTNTGPASPKVHLITAPWAEGAVTWSSFGAAFDPTVLASPSLASPAMTFDLSATVRAWVEGTIANDGILLRQAEPALTRYKSSEWGVLTQRPRLDLCYGLACGAGTADCDGSIQTGCETSLSTTSNCGGCGVPCARPNAATSCATGSCEITSCNEGSFDCNGNPDDGCEPLPCADGDQCAADTDCASGHCEDGQCTAPVLPACDPAVSAQIVALVDQADQAASVGNAAAASAGYAQATALAVCYQDALHVAAHAATRGYAASTNDAYAKAMTLSGAVLAVYLDIAAHAATRGYAAATNNAYAAATNVALTLPDTLSVAAHAATRGYAAATENAYAKAMIQANGQLNDYLTIADHAATRGYAAATNNAYAAATNVALTLPDTLSVAAHAATRGYAAATENAYAKAMIQANGQLNDYLAIADHAATRGYAAATNNAYAAATNVALTLPDTLSVAAHAAMRGYAAATENAYAKAMIQANGQLNDYLGIAAHAATRGYVAATNNAYAAATNVASTIDDVLSVAAHAAMRGYVAATNDAYAKATALCTCGGEALAVAAHAAARGYVSAANTATAKAATLPPCP
jgi:hypothetical protein